MACFSSQQLQFTLLEVNENSYTCLQQLIKTLQFENYIHRLEKADAPKWTLPANEQVDLFISETMQQGLKNEPQVAICMNLANQLQNSTIIIPEQITLIAALIDHQKKGLENSEAVESENCFHPQQRKYTAACYSLPRSKRKPLSFSFRNG